MSNPFVEFRFTFKVPSSNDERQHVLYIRRIDAENYEWIFNNSDDAKVMPLDEVGVYTNLRKLFGLLYWDSYPYTHFRVVFPAFPSTYVTMNNALAALPYIEEVMLTVFNNWPATITAADANQRMNVVFNDELGRDVPVSWTTKEDYTDDEEDGDEEAEDEDEDGEEAEEAEDEDGEEAEDEDGEEAEDEDGEEAEDADDEDEEDEFADMPSLISLSTGVRIQCPCSTPSRSTQPAVCPGAPKRRSSQPAENVVVDNTGPCQNTRSSKRYRLSEEAQPGYKYSYFE